jgi:hypothetical protein
MGLSEARVPQKNVRYSIAISLLFIDHFQTRSYDVVNLIISNKPMNDIQLLE